MTSIEALAAPPPLTEIAGDGSAPIQTQEDIAWNKGSHDEAGPAAPSLEAIAAGDVSVIGSQQDYQAAKAALSAPEPQGEMTVGEAPDEVDDTLVRDEFGDELASDDAELLVESLAESSGDAGAGTFPDDGSALASRAENAAAYEGAAELDPGLPATLGDLNLVRQETARAIRQQRLEIANAEVELRMEDKRTLTEELNALEQELELLDDYAPTVHAHEEQGHARYAEAYHESVHHVKQNYPEAMQPGTAFHARMAEIDRALMETGDPRNFAPDKPMLIAHMVAAELQVAPGGNRLPAVRATASAPQPPYASLSGGASHYLPPPVASGLARTSSPHTSNAEAAIAAVHTPDQLDKLKLQLLGRAAF